MIEQNSENRFVERRSAYVATEGEESPTAETEPSVEAAEPEPSMQEAVPSVEPTVEEGPGEPPAVDLDLEEMARVEIPEASFYEIVQPLEIQALQFLGELPLTADGQRGVLLRWAKHVIDLLGVLEERTRGNLPPEESQYLEQVLTDLRMRYVRASS
ncbi:MAG: DUF1844 domain-containing protein [Gemmatimonadota bacterium]